MEFQNLLKPQNDYRPQDHSPRNTPADNWYFATGISVREVVPRLTFSPSAPALIEVSRQCYAELITDRSNLSQILPEYLDYYSTAMLWLRIITLKQKNCQPIIQEEQDILNLVQTTAFVIPEPILLQLRQLGNVISSTKQHLYPEFPALPTQVINNHGGYYGTFLQPGPKVDNSIHNLYEEIPCLGVLTEAICAAISNMPPGPYQSNVTFHDQQPTQNLLGFRALGVRRQESKNLAFYNNITEVDFRAYPPQTGFNVMFLVTISNFLANTKIFKNTEVVFSTLSEVGGKSQLVISHPLLTPGTTCLQGEQIVTSLCQDSPAIYGAAIFFDSQLIKESGLENDVSAWCLFNSTPAHPIPQEWIENRNERRNLPLQYMERVFTSISQQAALFRFSIIKTLVLKKR